MAKVNIEKKTEITIDGRKYSEEDAREIYESLKDHFDTERENSNKSLKEILDEIDKMDKPYTDPWVEPLKPYPYIPWPKYPIY